MPRNNKYKGFVNLGASIKNSLGFLGKNYDPALLTLNKNWSEIIGGQYFKYCKPERLAFRKGKKGDGVLYVVVFSPALSLYIDSNKKYILDKINTFFGYRAVGDIKIKQTPQIIEEYEPKKAVKNVDKAEEARLLSIIGQNIDKGLKGELEELGKAMLRYGG